MQAKQYCQKQDSRDEEEFHEFGQCPKFREVKEQEEKLPLKIQLETPLDQLVEQGHVKSAMQYN